MTSESENWWESDDFKQQLLKIINEHFSFDKDGEIYDKCKYRRPYHRSLRRMLRTSKIKLQKSFKK